MGWWLFCKKSSVRPVFPDRKHADLVDAIKNHSLKNNKEIGTQYVLGEFAELLSALAADADKSAAINEELQRKVRDYTRVLIALTWALFFIGAIQIVVTVWTSNTQKQPVGTNQTAEPTKPQEYQNSRYHHHFYRF